MARWSLDDIPWHTFDAAKANPQLVSLAKAASMVEYNGHDYARYLCEVFSDDAEFQDIAKQWAIEEVQHGQVLRKWAELADPTFDFEKSFATFTNGYKLPEGVNASVRGSKCGELIARCMVEIGTSSYYTAIKESTDEPVLQAICAKIAADELAHYKLFYTQLQRYLKKENLNAFQRFKVAMSRIAESEDDELAYAYFAAHNDASVPYVRKTYTNRYLTAAYKLYRKGHIERMVSMGFKAVGFKPHSIFSRMATHLAWGMMQLRCMLAAKQLRTEAL